MWCSIQQLQNSKHSNFVVTFRLGAIFSASKKRFKCSWGPHHSYDILWQKPIERASSLVPEKTFSCVCFSNFGVVCYICSKQDISFCSCFYNTYLHMIQSITRYYLSPLSQRKSKTWYKQIKGITSLFTIPVGILTSLF